MHEMMAWCTQFHGATAAQGSTSAPSSSTKRFDNFSLLKFKVFLVTCPMSQLGK